MTYDVIVLGLGGMGSAAAYHLARRGRRVLGLDRHSPAHDQGASHGRSRIIREAYWEHPSYVPLVQRAYELWADLERAGGRLLLLKTGGINIGAPHSDLVRGALESARIHRLTHEVLDAAAIRRRFPVFQPSDDMVGVYEPRAGILVRDPRRPDPGRDCPARRRAIRRPAVRWRSARRCGGSCAVRARVLRFLRNAQHDAMTETSTRGSV